MHLWSGECLATHPRASLRTPLCLYWWRCRADIEVLSHLQKWMWADVTEEFWLLSWLWLYFNGFSVYFGLSESILVWHLCLKGYFWFSSLFHVSLRKDFSLCVDFSSIHFFCCVPPCALSRFMFSLWLPSCVLPVSRFLPCGSQCFEF